jgi:hypothetical protein
MRTPLGTRNMTAMTNGAVRSGTRTAVLLLIEVPLLLVALLVVHYGGIPFGLSTYEPGWCFDHGLPGRESSGGDDVRIEHTSWPLGITCTYGATTVRFPDWPATFLDYGFLAVVVAGIVVTVTVLLRRRRRMRRAVGRGWSEDRAPASRSGSADAGARHP